MDPYYDFASDLTSSLQSLTSLHSSYLRILQTLPPTSHSNSEELAYALSELRSTLAGVEVDLGELEEIVLSVEKGATAGGGGKGKGLGREQVRERRLFLERVRGEVSLIRNSLSCTSSSSTVDPRTRLSGGYRLYGKSNGEDEDEDDDEKNPEEEFELQHQSILRTQQDRTLTDISGTVNLLREQARVMGQEVVDQNSMLEDLDGHLDSTTAKLSKAQRRMGNFVRENQSSPASWCIFLLIIVLTVLLVFIVFF